MYTSQSCTAVTAMAKRCSSPPDSTATSRSRRCVSDRSSHTTSATLRSSLRLTIVPTTPLTALGMWSTNCGLIAAFRLSSKILVK
mmetsp:Transcript_16172/g.50606  ORF Transcript_16172/g.50606 Transcript_16172/m.50606 type:complete len:85 (-) Transcript_16172:595-849(-)